MTEEGGGGSEGEEDGEEGGEEEDEGEGEGGGGGRVTEVKWHVPDGFKVADEPEKLDGGLVGDYVFMRWEQYGWQLGKITAQITNATPRLVKNFNYRITWADGSKGPSKLDAQSYAHGSEARYNSWVIMKTA